MEREPFFVRSLEKGGGVVVIDNSNRHYFKQMINVKKVPNLVYLDEKMDIIGTMELNPQEAEVYVEQKLEDLVKREDAIVKREALSMQKEFELAEREQKLNIRENEFRKSWGELGIDITDLDKAREQIKSLFQNANKEETKLTKEVMNAEIVKKKTK